MIKYSQTWLSIKRIKKNCQTWCFLILYIYFRLLWLDPETWRESQQPAFMDNCLTISHMCLPWLPSRWVTPCVLYPIMIRLMMVGFMFFFKHDMILVLWWVSAILRNGYGNQGQNILLHCFKEVKFKQGLTTWIWY